jgi:PAS domain S-box-containing protein
MFKGSLFRKTGLAWMILGIGLLVTVFVSLQVKQGLDEAAVRRFAFSCDQVTLEIQDRLGIYEQILRGSGALFSASNGAERKEWKAYVESLRAERSTLGMQGIGYAQVISADRLGTYIAEIRGEGLAEYTMHPPGERPVYAPIAYFEPLHDNDHELRLLGFDMYSEPIRRAAMDQSRDTGEAVLTGKVGLVQETETVIHTEVFMYIPVYRRGVLVNSVEQRRVALSGWVFSSYRMNDLIAGILADWVSHDGKMVDLTIYEGSEAVSANLLFDSQPTISPDTHSLFYQQRTINFKGRQWLLEFSDASALSTISYLPVGIAMICGLVFSGLLFGLMRSMINTQANAVRIADKLSEESKRQAKLLMENEAFKLAILNSLAAKTPDGAVRIANTLYNESQRQAKLLMESEAFKLTMMNSLAAEIAVVDRTGVIQTVNEPWRHFDFKHRIESDESAPLADVGTNYLEVCQTGTGFALEEDAWHAHDGIQAVLDGNLSSFSFEYASHLPTQKRWFMMTALPMGDGDSRKVVVTHTDITDRKQAEEKLQIFSKEQAAIFDSVTSGIVLIKDSVIVNCNRKLEAIFGYATGEIIGKSTRCWYVDDAIYEKDRKVIEDSHFHRIEIQLIRMDGSFFWARLSGQALDSKDPALGIVAIIDDITPEHEATDALLKAKEMAENATRITSEFLTNMSHGIRTPMNGVLGMLDLLRETDMTPIQLDWLETAHSSGEILREIVNNILDLSKLQAGKVEIEQVNFNLVDLVNDVCAAMIRQAHVKGLELNCFLPDSIPIRWRGDPLRIRQVLANLIDNAVKFTERGEVSVRVVASVSGGIDELRFEVNDTGIGMSPELQLQLFEFFSQTDGTLLGRFDGSGLGLFISKKLVELMGGNIGVSSVKGLGSIFWITLPMVPSEGIEVEKLFYDFSGKVALVIDDNMTNRNLLSTYLSRWGLQVRTFDNARSALIQLQTAAINGLVYDLILLNMNMSAMDGLTFAKQLAEIPALKKIPIIVLTSGDQLAFSEYQATGIVQCLLNPVRELQLFDAMSNALQGSLPAIQKVEKTELEIPSYRTKKVLLVEDNKINQKVIIAMLSQYDIDPDIAENGQIALDKLAKSVYDLILMDCQMPVMDGYITTRELRLLEARLDLPHQPVIALTADAMKGDREKCLAAGMDDYLAKPIDTELLDKMLMHQLS